MCVLFLWFWGFSFVPVEAAFLRGSSFGSSVGSRPDAAVVHKFLHSTDDEFMEDVQSFIEGTHNDIGVIPYMNSAGSTNSSTVSEEAIQTPLTSHLQLIGRLIDTNNDTFLSHEELKRFADSLKEQQRWKQTLLSFQRVDLDGSSSITLDEIYSAARNQTEAVVRHQVERFNAADLDGNNWLNISEFHAFLYPQLSEMVFMIEKEFEFKRYDTDGNGLVDFKEFGSLNHAQNSEDFDEESTREDFDLHDSDRSGDLDHEEFGRLLTGHDLLVDSITKTIRAGDSDGDGQIHMEKELPGQLQRILESEFVEDFLLHKDAANVRPTRLHDEL